MPIYRLPTKSPIKYRGNRPNHFRMISWGTDCDGRRAMHVETLSGDRFTVPTVIVKALGHGEVLFNDDTIETFATDYPIVDMPQAVYEDWLGRIRSERAAKA